MSDLQAGSDSGQGRQFSRITSLLVELSRVMKARLYYPPGNKNLLDLFERTWENWRQELRENGALELEVRSGYFVLTEAAIPLDPDGLGTLAHEFELRGLRKVRFEPNLEPEVFQTFVSTLTTPPDSVARSGGVERMLAACAGLSVTGSSSASQSVAAVDVGPDTVLLLQAEDESVVQVDADSLEVAPLETQASDPRGQVLLDRLMDLEYCEADSSYDPLLESTLATAITLFHEGLRNEAYRATLVIAKHCTDDAKRSHRQRELARVALAKLLQGPLLEDLIERSCAAGGVGSVRAAQILVQLGDSAVRPIFDALYRERSPERRGHLNGVLITFGPVAHTALERILDSGDLPRMRLALRLFGELQNPEAVERLTEFLASQDGSLCKEAAKALARIGSRSAIQTLVAALRSPNPEVPLLATFCLGATRNPRALQPLLSNLGGALEKGNVPLARETLRALGRLGLEGASEALAAIITRKSLLHRKRMLELKLTATIALGHIPGETAVEALTQAARNKDARLRKTAQDALDRRAA